MKENQYNFEMFLQDIHSDEYHGTDDDMPADFEKFLSELDPYDWLELGDKYAQSKK